MFCMDCMYASAMGVPRYAPFSGAMQGMPGAGDVTDDISSMRDNVPCPPGVHALVGVQGVQGVPGVARLRSFSIFTIGCSSASGMGDVCACSDSNIPGCPTTITSCVQPQGFHAWLETIFERKNSVKYKLQLIVSLQTNKTVSMNSTRVLIKNYLKK